MIGEALIQEPAVGKSKPQYLSLRAAKMLCISHTARLPVSAQDTVTDMLDDLHSTPVRYFRVVSPGDMDIYYFGSCLKRFLEFQKPAKFFNRP